MKRDAPGLEPRCPRQRCERFRDGAQVDDSAKVIRKNEPSIDVKSGQLRQREPAVSCRDGVRQDDDARYRVDRGSPAGLMGHKAARQRTPGLF